MEVGPHPKGQDNSPGRRDDNVVVVNRSKYKKKKETLKNKKLCYTNLYSLSDVTVHL